MVRHNRHKALRISFLTLYQVMSVVGLVFLVASFTTNYVGITSK